MWDAPSVLSVLWRTSWQSAVVAGVVLGVRAVLGWAITHRWRHALWALVLCRLLMPVSPQSRASLFNLWRPSESPQRALATVPLVAPSIRVLRPVADDPDAFVNVPPSPVPPPPRWPSLLMIGWLFIAAGLIGRLAWVNARFAAAIRRGSQLTDPRLVALLDACRREMRCRRSVRLIVTDAVDAPAACGVLWPRVLLPISLAHAGPNDRLRLVLLHELAHVRGHDVAIDWLWAVVGALHWFNPVLWAIASVRRNDRELARDEQVLSIAGPADAERYGRALLELAQPACRVPFCPGLVGMFTGRGPLRRRVEAVATHRGRRPIATCAGIAVLIGTASCALTTPTQTPSPVAAPAITTTMPSTAPAFATPYDPDKPSDAVQAKLEKHMNRVRFEATPLEKAFDSLRDQAGMNVFVDWLALEEAGVSRTAPVTMTVYDVSVGSAIQLVCRSVAKQENPLDYVVDEGVVTISSVRELNRNVVSRTYDIGDLLFTTEDRSVSLDVLKQPPVTAIERAKRASDRAERIKEIVQYIQENVDANSWKDAGGEVGTIGVSPTGSALLITQTPASHRKIRAVLDSLRASQSIQVVANVRFFAVEDDADLPASVRQTLAQSSMAPTGQVISPADAQRLIATLGTDRHVETISAPQLTMFSGQRVEVAAVTQQPYIQSYTAAVKQANGTVVTNYTPVKQDLSTGLRFDMQATASPDRRSVFVDLHPTISRLAGIATAHWPGALPAAAVFVQTPVVVTSATQTSCAVPDGATLLVRCGGFAPGDDHPVADPTIAAAVDRARSTRVYLMLAPRLLLDPRAVADVSNAKRRDRSITFH